jgi:hypothetical protein
MTAEERLAIRLAIDAARRRRVRFVCEGGWENPETGYRRGCRCDFCRLGTGEARERRRRRKALADGAA